MVDCLEDQRSEIEALQSIYPDEFQLTREEPFYSFNIIVKTEDYEEDTEEGAYCILGFTYVENYPNEPPEFEIEEIINLNEEDTESLSQFIKDSIQENLGMVMVFTIVSSVQEWLHNKVEYIKTKKIEDSIREIREAEEAEQKRFEGTIVTVESFLKWKTQFDADMAALKRQSKLDAGSKKLTGRELFERDHTLNESDIKFLQDGEDDIKVDESLFQELDDLELEELNIDDELEE